MTDTVPTGAPTLAAIDAETFDRLTQQVSLPIEQSPEWDEFDEALDGREPWRVFAVRAGGQAWCVVRLSLYSGRGFTYIWAKHGPVWLTEPTPEREAQVRRLLVAAIRKARPRTAFVRLHARHRAEDTRELLQTMTYDQTVIVDLRPSEDEIFADMRQRGRRCIRKGLKDETLAVTEETGLGRQEFAALYELLVETGARDGFGIAEEQVYWTMLQSLGQQRARIFVTRREGRALAWAIVTVHDRRGVYYYGASNAEGRKAWAADLLHWRIMQTLKDEGVESYDFMGTASDRAPELRGVTEFKTKFASEQTPVDGAWDVPVQPILYRGLVRALAAKRGVSAGLRSAQYALGGLVQKARGRGTTDDVAGPDS